MISLTLLLLLPVDISPQNQITGQLLAEVWQALDPIPPDGVERNPFSKEDFMKDGFEEARRWFSGMIYGYKFSYEPSDLNRQVEEVMDLLPLGEIPWGDSALKFLDSRVMEKEGRIYLRFTYDLSRSQITQLDSGRRQTLKPAGGRGGVQDKFLLSDRWDALKMGLKEGIRSYLRPREYNKPRRITGEIFLRRPPSILNSQGQIFATTDFYLHVQEIREYLIP